jgi:tRNA(Ile)-lysidine synthase
VLKDFYKYIEGQTLCSKKDKILIAVSGGIDSMVMLDLFILSKYNIAIAHCNFQLRGKAADEDEFFVKKVGQKLGLKVFTKKFETQKYADLNKLSIQEAARDLRYGWFDELIEEEGFNYVALAQHLNDQAETFFINLMRGSGLTGLRGMPVKRGKIIRPMMFANKSKIEDYAKKHKLSSREDASNKKDTYLRNKIRLKLIPELEKISENAFEKTIESMHFLNEAEIILSQLIDEKFDVVFKQKDGYLCGIKHEIERLHPLDAWIYYFLKRFNFNRDVIKSLAVAIQEKQSGKHFYSATHEALISRGELLIRPLQKGAQEEYLINEDQVSMSEPLAIEIKTLRKDADFKIESFSHIAQLDKGKLHFPLTLRRWQQNDRFIPLGMKGSKLVSDFFIDSKISNFGKDDVWLLVSANEIAWVVGFRISDRFKVTPNTEQVLSIKCC